MGTTANHVWKPSAARVLVMDGFVPGPRGVPVTTLATPSWPAKDPVDVLDYQFDISPALTGNDGDGLATLDVAITPANPGDLSLASAAADGSRAVLWLQGGVAGTTYTVTLSLGTQAGRVLARSVLLPVVSLSSPVGAVTGPSATALTTDSGDALTDENGNALQVGGN